MDAIQEDLSKAVCLGQLEKVKDLINRHGGNSSGAYGYYGLLRNSALLGHTEITKLLLTSGSEETIKRRKIISSNTPLHFAVLDDDLEIIEMLLAYGADINARNECGLSPLVSAIRMGKCKIVDLLLKKGTNSKCCNNGYSPLHLAAEQALHNINKRVSNRSPKAKENEEFFSLEKGVSFVRVKLLLNSKVDDNDRTSNMITTLYLAVLNCHREHAKFLMDHKDKIGAELENGDTALFCDVCKGLSILFEDILTTCPGRSNGSTSSVINEAGGGFGNNNSTVVENLLNYGFNFKKGDANRATLQFKILDYEYSKLIRRKYREYFRGECSSWEGYYKNAIFHITTKDHQVDIVKLIFEKKKCKDHAIATDDNDGFGEYPDPDLEHRISHLNITKIMLLHDPQSFLRFDDCVGRSKVSDVADIFYEYKAELYCIANDFSPLQIAAYRGDEETIKMLIANGMNVNSKRRNGDTALHIVARTSHTHVLKILLKNGADVYCKNKLGATPLHVASEGNHPEIVSILLLHGSPVDSKNKSHETPLDIAIIFSKSEIMKILLKFGADCSRYKLSYDCLTDIFFPYYCERRHKEVLNVLKSHIDSIMLRCANLLTDNQYKGSNTDSGYNNVFEKKCESEINKIKREKVKNTNLSFYDILTRQSLAKFAKYEDILEIFQSQNYKIMFPIYATILERNLKRALLYEYKRTNFSIY